MKKFSEILLFSKDGREVVFSDFNFVGFSDIKKSEDRFSGKAEFSSDKEVLQSKVTEFLDREVKNVYDIESAMNSIVGSWVKNFNKKFTTVVSKNFIQFVSTNYPDIIIKEIILKDGNYDPAFDFDKAYFDIPFFAKGD